MCTIDAIDASIVIFRNSREQLESLFKSLAAQSITKHSTLRVFIRNNDPSNRKHVEACIAQICASLPLDITIAHSERNIGFGAAHNENFRLGSAPFFLVLNPDGALWSDAIERLVEHAHSDPVAAAWEMRQVPYEHPKMYRPSTLETPWVAGAAVMFRRSAYQAVNGFDARIFLYGEDVDLSWRLRAQGWKLRYIPRANFVHHTYDAPGQIKPSQTIGSIYASLCLRARYGTVKQILGGLGLWMAELCIRQPFAGRRQALINVLRRFFCDFRYFRRSGTALRRSGFQPEFMYWDYGLHRDGAFHAFHCTESTDTAAPKVSIVVRTCARPALLREALQSIVYQTYRNIEVIVVEDGAPHAQHLVETEFKSQLNVRYFSTYAKVGRSTAGNLGLKNATGEWLGFLDDDDQLFADHVEVLVHAALSAQRKVVYGTALEIGTRIESSDNGELRYIEKKPVIRYRQPFSKLTLWKKNFLPIQSVLFHRDLFERYGGFDEDLDQLEDWLLWVRYSLENDFQWVNKVTSLYRVPYDRDQLLARHAKLRAAYPSAIARQYEMRVCLSPRVVVDMIDEHMRSHALIYVSNTRFHNLAIRFPILRRLYSAILALLPGRRRKT